MESIKDLKQLLAEAREREDEKSVANLTFKLGDIYLERGKRDLAISLLLESFDLCEKHENPQAASVVALSLAAGFLQEKDDGQAESYARTAYGFYEKEEDPKGLVQACLLRGDILWSREESGGALPFYRQALEICIQHGDNLGTATFLDRIAAQHRLLGQEEEALGRLHAAKQIWDKLGIPDRQAVTLTNMADILRKKGDLPEAIRLYEQALPLYRGLKQPRTVEILEKELSDLKASAEKGKPGP